MFLGKQFKVGRCINTDWVCLTALLQYLVMNLQQVEVNPSLVIITFALLVLCGSVHQWSLSVRY